MEEMLSLVDERVQEHSGRLTVMLHVIIVSLRLLQLYSSLRFDEAVLKTLSCRLEMCFAVGPFIWWSSNIVLHSCW